MIEPCETTDVQATALQFGNLSSFRHQPRLLGTPLMEPGDGLGGVNEVPRLLGETRSADPTNAILQGPSDLSRVFHGFDMVFGFLALHYHGRRWWYYLAGKRIFSNRGEKGDQLNRVDLYTGRELQFVSVGMYRAHNRERAEFFQSSFRAGCVVLMCRASSQTWSPGLNLGAGRRALS